MTRAGAKAVLVAMSLVATAGGWAVLAGQERGATPAASAAAPITVALSNPGPAQPPPGASAGALAAAPPAVATPAPPAAANPPRAVARTRSSR